MAGLDSVLDELEAASGALEEISIENSEHAQAVMDRRSRAVAALSEALSRTALNPDERERALGVLRGVCEIGERAQQRLATIKSATVRELNQFTQLYRALNVAGPGSGRVDFSG